MKDFYCKFHALQIKKICTEKGCKDVLLCQECELDHKKVHTSRISILAFLKDIADKLKTEGKKFSFESLLDQLIASKDLKELTSFVTMLLKLDEMENKPIATKNGFFHYLDQWRDDFAQRYPSLSPQEISQLAGMKWKEMTEKEKLPYRKLAEAGKEISMLKNEKKIIDIKNMISQTKVEDKKKKKIGTLVEPKPNKKMEKTKKKDIKLIHKNDVKPDHGDFGSCGYDSEFSDRSSSESSSEDDLVISIKVPKKSKKESSTRTTKNKLTLKSVKKIIPIIIL